MNKVVAAATAAFITISVEPALSCHITEQDSVTAERFYDPTTFGRLGLESGRGYFRIIDRVACFDATDYYRKSALNILFNHATTNPEHASAPSYLAAQVITVVSNRQQAAEFSLYRSSNDRDNPERGLWAHPKTPDQLPSLSEFSFYPDNELRFADQWTDPPASRESTNDDYDLYVSNTWRSDSYKRFTDRYGKWHALLVNRDRDDLRGTLNANGRSRTTTGRDDEMGSDRPYRAVQNTWDDRYIWNLPPDELNGLVRQQGSYRMRQYLIHYRPFLKRPGSGEIPQYRVTIPIGSRDASCIYVRTMGPSDMGTYFAIANGSLQRFVALRVNPNAECVAPPPPPSAWNLFTRRTALGQTSRRIESKRTRGTRDPGVRQAWAASSAGWTQPRGRD